MVPRRVARGEGGELDRDEPNAVVKRVCGDNLARLRNDSKAPQDIELRGRARAICEARTTAAREGGDLAERGHEPHTVVP